LILKISYHIYIVCGYPQTLLEITSWKITLRLIPGGFLIIGRESRRHSTMNNPETQSTLGTRHSFEDTTQKTKKIRDEQHLIPQKNRG
jgi:hypothetical protein